MVRSITNISDLGPLTPLWRRILLRTGRQTDLIEHRLSCEFAVQSPVAFDEVKARVWASIERNKDDWVDDEGMAGEGGEAMALNDLLAAAKDAVDRAANVKELFENLDAAWPY